MSLFELTREDFLDFMSKSREIVEMFSNTSNVLLNNIYTLYLSNGDKLTYEVNVNNIPHLLGIKNMGDLLNEKLTSFNALKKLVNSSAARNSVIKTIEGNGWKYSTFLSSHYGKKIKYIKEQLSVPYPKTILFVCKYKMELNLGSSDLTDRYKDCEYYIGRKANNGDILVTGFSKNNNGKYTPRTSRIFLAQEAEEELHALLANQILCFPNALETKNYISTSKLPLIYLLTQDKIETLQNLKSFAKSTGASVDCSQDYLAKLRKNIASVISTSVLKEELGNMAASIKSGELIEISEENLEDCNDCKEEVQELMEAINDKLCVVSKNDKTKVAYSSALKEMKKKELELLKKEAILSKYEDRINALEEENKALKKENETLNILNKKTTKKLDLLLTSNIEKKDE